ncbi:helix-turn-helix transcriptional regulator [Haliea sp. E1-2-M8]
MYDMASRGQFPSPIKIGPRASAWVAAEVDAWIERRIVERMTS